jgi:hypothetical protein
LKKSGFPATALLLAATALQAQNHPSITYASPVTLAPGAVAYSGTSQSPRWEIRVIEVDTRERNINLVPVRALPGTLQSTSALATRVRAVGAINGGYFGASPAQSFSHFQLDGAVIDRTVASRPARSVFGISANHQQTLAITRLNSAGDEVLPFNPSWPTVVDAIGAGPRLLSNGAIDVRNVEEEFDAASGINANGREPRTAIGFNTNTGRVWLVTVDGRQTGWSVGMTLTELAGLLQDLGAREGLNMDGGGSTTSWVTSGVFNRPSNSGNAQRSVINALAVVPSYLIDNTDSEFTTTGPWSASANAGFYNSNSLFSPAGDGSSTATWRPNLARAGRYEVAAWWVAASNRAPAAPFVVQHRNGSTAVPQDQRNNGGRWVVLGEFEFNPGTAGSVSVTNAIGTGQFVSADAVRFVLLQELNPLPTPLTVTGWTTH